MLTRIMSGLVMAAVVILAIFKLPPAVFNLLAMLLMLGGLLEWCRLCSGGRIFFGAATLLLWILFGVYTTGSLTTTMIPYLLAAAVILWVVKTLRLSSDHKSSRLPCMADAVLSLGLAWLAMVSLRDQMGVQHLMLALLMVWSADSFAYFGGKRFGKTKLAPGISPGKTREGVASGMLAAMVVAVIYTHFMIAPIASFMQMLLILFVSALVALISVVGDLSESKLKRAAGKKDSGHLIPGHGGILDRIDGLIAGVVLYAFYMILVTQAA